MKLAPILGLVLMLAPLGADVSAREASGARSCSVVTFEDSFDVIARPRQRVYRIGDVALVDVRVIDAVTGAPQSGIEAGLSVRGQRDRALVDVSTTNEQGRATLRLRLRRSATRLGAARATAAAWESVNTPVYCTGRSGQQSYPELFRVRP